MRIKTLYTEQQLQKRIGELGAQISREYQDSEPLLIGILRGAFIFLSDLARSLSILCTFDFMAVSSYGTHTKTTGVVRILKDLNDSIEGKHLIIVEDIVDTGLTMQYLLNFLKVRQPASIKSCALLDKKVCRVVDVTVDYVGFEIPDIFVLGYGLDYHEKYRNLPFIGILEDDNT